MTSWLHRTRHRRPAALALALSCCVLLSAVAASDPAPTAVESEGRDAGLRDRALAIVDTYTPDKPVYVRPFDSGLRVMGVTVEFATEYPAREAGSRARFEWNPPEWLDRDELLGYVDSGDTIIVRLLWRAEDTRRTLSGPESFTVMLNQHRGYYKVNQNSPAVVVHPGDHPTGSVFWTEHTFSEASTVYPGLFDVMVRNRAVPSTLIPLGEVFIRGRIRPDPVSPPRQTTLYPSGVHVFADRLTLTQWYRYTMPVPAPPFQPRSLALTSSLDWIEKEENGLDVAELTVVRASGDVETFRVKLGRDTAFTWYELHTRGNLRHTQAPIAWSWPVEQETVRFDAAVYRGVFELQDDPSPPVEVSIAYLLDEGVLRVHGITLLP